MTAKDKVAQNAAIYLRRGKYLLQPYFQATSGIHLGGEPVTVLESHVADEELGRGLLQALSASKTGVPLPADWSQVVRHEQLAAGVRSWASFVRGTSYCSAERDDSRIHLLPSRNAGSREGFIHLPAVALSLERGTSPAQLGVAIRAALMRCE